MRSRKPRKVYDFVVDPVAHLGGDADDDSPAILKAALDPHDTGDMLLSLQAVRLRGSWAATLPVGAFGGVFGGVFSPAATIDDQAAFERLYSEAKRTLGTRQFADPLTAKRLWFKPGGTGPAFFKADGLDFIRQHFEVPVPVLFVALTNFLRFVDRGNATAITGVAPRAFTPFAARPKIGNRHVRGPSWDGFEDAILRRYFGPQPDGTRIRMEPAYWEILLQQLGGRRTKASILQRVSDKNAALRRSLMVDGFLKPDGAARYRKEAWGQRPCVPRHRIRLDGSYGGLAMTADAKALRIRAPKGKPIDIRVVHLVDPNGETRAVCGWSIADVTKSKATRRLDVATCKRCRRTCDLNNMENQFAQG